MPIELHITFKAGICDVGEKGDAPGGPRHIVPRSTPGFIYLYTSEDDLLHFCWRPRTAPLSEPELDLIMFPGDGTFKPYQQHGSSYKKADPDYQPSAPSNGRLYVLSFSSSSDRHLFYLQSKTQSPSGDSTFHSPRDLKIGEIVNTILAGEEVNVQEELRNLSHDQNGPGGGDDDTAMEDADGGPGSQDHHRAASGGAGTDATGGDFREEGEEAREGGADGGRAFGLSRGEAAPHLHTSCKKLYHQCAELSSSFTADYQWTHFAVAPINADAQDAVSTFLKSLQGQSLQGRSLQDQSLQGKPFTTLPELLPPSTTLPMIEKADDEYMDELLRNIPPALLVTEEAAEEIGPDPDAETVEALIMSLDAEQKKDILRKVLRSPQFTQSLGSLTSALADGGLPSLAGVLKIRLENGGYEGRVPLGGGRAIEAFVQGVKAFVEEEEKAKKGDEMDTQ